ncbi:MAG: hypothetical protein COA88_05455 [Kordia sp.]|nr:MAG: hypothetical protein COA88_05455 [Kordia sp.]
MSIKGKIILDTRRATEEGYPLKIRVYDSVIKKHKYVSLFWYSDIHHWENGLLKSHPDFRRLNGKLNKRAFALQEEIEYCNKQKLNLTNALKLIEAGLEDKELEIFFLKQRLKELEGNYSAKLIDFYDVRIKEKIDFKEDVRPFELTKKQIQDFTLQDIAINEVTYEWLNEFILYKKREGTGEAGIMYYLKNIRIIYKEAQRRESLGIKTDNPFLGLIKTVSRKSEIVSLEDEDFKKLLNIENSVITSKAYIKSTNELVNIWLFQFFVGGHDLADIANLTWTKLKNNRITFKRHKNRRKRNGGATVDVKLFPKALDIIEKYGTKKEVRIFGFIPEVETTEYEYFRQNASRRLKLISKKLELTDTIKTKSPRYLFRTRSGQLLIDTHIMELIQGHKSQGVSFNYQGEISYEIQDREHEKVISFLNYL